MTNKGKAAKLKPPKIDYPKVNEAVSGHHYAARISAEGCKTVEAALDGGPYSPCHNASGHWWYHLHVLAKGPHKISVRAQISDGETVSVLRRFRVKE
jgi:hypothetical protein